MAVVAVAILIVGPDTDHLAPICGAVNEVDASAPDSPDLLRFDLAEFGMTLHLAESKGR